MIQGNSRNDFPGGVGSVSGYLRMHLNKDILVLPIGDDVATVVHYGNTTDYDIDTNENSLWDSATSMTITADVDDTGWYMFTLCGIRNEMNSTKLMAAIQIQVNVASALPYTSTSQLPIAGPDTAVDNLGNRGVFPGCAIYYLQAGDAVTLTYTQYYDVNVSVVNVHYQQNSWMAVEFLGS